MAAKPAKDLKKGEKARRRGETPRAPDRAEHPTFGRDEVARILAARESWTREELAEAVARLPARKASFETDSGIPVPPVLDPASVREADYLRDVGHPGRRSEERRVGKECRSR